MISEDLGIKLENVTLDMLGTAKKVAITKDDTTIVDGAGTKEDIEGPRRSDQASRSKKPLPITTVKNCKSVWRNSLAVLL